MRFYAAILAILFVGLVCYGQGKQIPYTLEDRDRMLRLEEAIKALNAKIDNQTAKFDVKFDAQTAKFDAKFDAQSEKFEARFDSLQKQIDFTNSLILTLIASVIGSIFYMAWDRSRANAPIKESLEEQRKKMNVLVESLKEYAATHPELKSIFDKAAIL